MSDFFKQSINFVSDVDPDSVFVEIGSDRYEGSTLFFAELAQQFNTVLHSVDLSIDAKSRIHHPAIVWHQARGSEWSQKVYPTINRKISLLYLDNFDWCWDVHNIKDVEHQIFMYRNSYNIEMTNENCQLEHLAQTVNLMPWMSDNALVVLDDTYIEKLVWTGKSGPALLYFKLNGFEVVSRNNHAVILKRNSHAYSS